MRASERIEKEWGEYFSREGKTFFQKLLMFHRRVFISRAVRHWFNRYFPRSGLFLEAGAGTSESSGRIDAASRELVAVDICEPVLRVHNVLPVKVRANIFRLPFREGSVDGIWNLGVMEHFTDEQIVRMLREFHRVLKPGARVVLFWPPWFAPYELVLNSIAWLAWKLFGKRLVFFPDEINLYRTRGRARDFLERAGFRMRAAHFSVRDLYSYIVVVADAEKPARS